MRWITPLNKNDFAGKRILDCGCGIGRNAYWALKYGAKEVVAFDYDRRTVSVCKKNLSEFNNAHVYYDSIYKIKYEEYFDIVFSIGVIHHLENPHLAVQNMVKAAKKGGTVLIWVYGYEGNEGIVKYVNPVRRFFSKFPVGLTYFFLIFFYSTIYIFKNCFSRAPISKTDKVI